MHMRRGNIHFIAYNTRFLILPWINVRHVASHILGAIARRIGADWQAAYHHPVYMLETFVDTERFAATCYKAANWHQCIGQIERAKYYDEKSGGEYYFPLDHALGLEKDDFATLDAHEMILFASSACTPSELEQILKKCSLCRPSTLPIPLHRGGVDEACPNHSL